MAALTVQLGAKVTATIDGHSAIDGANMLAGSKVEIVSNDPAVGTVDPIPDLAMDSPSLSVPVNVLGVGSADLTANVTRPDGTVDTSAYTLIVGEVVQGLTHITLTLTSP